MVPINVIYNIILDSETFNYSNPIEQNQPTLTHHHTRSQIVSKNGNNARMYKPNVDTEVVPGVMS